MKPTASRQLVLLAVLGVLVVAVIARRAEGPTAVDPRASNGRQAAATSAAQETPVADLRLDLLKGESADELKRRLAEHYERTRPREVRRSEAWDRWWIMTIVVGLWTTSWALRRRSGRV